LHFACHVAAEAANRLRRPIYHLRPPLSMIAKRPMVTPADAAFFEGHFFSRGQALPFAR
jgi:hypothetical protein